MTRRTTTEPMDWEHPSERYLAYLGRLSAACLAQDREEIDRLLRMRLSSHLPRTVLDELESCRRSRSENLRAPLRLMRYVHKMQQLALMPPDPEQFPLELRERGVAAPPPASAARRPARSRKSPGQ